MRYVRFPKPVGRTYGYFALPILARLPRSLDAGVTPELRVRGNADIATVPGSKRIIDGPIHPGPRNMFTTNNRDLVSGPPPSYIRRRSQALNGGVIGPGGVSGNRRLGATGYPTDGGSMYIPHQRVPRWPITVTAFRRTIDTSSTIPARGIGAPVK
jgi:hypothetical protein